MATYQVELTGVTPLLMHWDNIEWAETLKRWRSNPNNKGKSVAGDDRSPAWTWLGSLYRDRGVVCMPADNLQTMLREGGAKVSTGKKQETFKRHTQSGLVVNEASWPLLVHGNTIDARALFEKLHEEEDYQIHKQTVESLGFILHEKRAKIGTAKHIRVRPRFDNWSCSGTITVFDDALISADSLGMILEAAGNMCGLCDWRPSSPKSPGPNGKFTVKIKKQK